MLMIYVIYLSKRCYVYVRFRFDNVVNVVFVVGGFFFWFGDVVFF